MRVKAVFGKSAPDVFRPRRRPSRLPYRFDGLPSQKTIRLLELHPAKRETDEIRVSLRAFDLAQAPLYHALSYTWGYPLTGFSKTTASYGFRRLEHLRQRMALRSLSHRNRDGEPQLLPGPVLRNDSRCFPISCDGQTVLVTANLFDALHMLRERRASNTFLAGSNYFWIDAICIDQANVLERNAQVILMADIFRGSRGVVTWLGAEDQFTQDAITVIDRISEIPKDSWKLLGYTDFFNAEWHSAVGAKAVTQWNWLGFLAFINRPWFRRAWVVQELALAPSAMLVCGSRIIDWGKMEAALSLIRTKSWYHHLSTEKIRHIRDVQDRPGIYTDFLKSKTDFRMGAFALAQTRKMVSTQIASPRPGPLSFSRLMQVHRDTEATDPRDKVYAFVGLAGRGTNAPGRQDLQRPDYNLPVEEVYRRTTVGFLRSTGNLSILSHVQDAARTKLPRLPSWVPDFSVRLTPYPLSFRYLPSRWSACGNLKWSPNEDAMAKGRLHVQGFCVDTVAETVPLRSEAPDSITYWAAIVQLAMCLDESYQCESAAFLLKTAQSRLEALWRTLVTDTYARKNPAPPECGRLFIDYILNLQIRHTLSPWSKIDFQPHQTPTERGIPQWHKLFSAEPKESPYGSHLYRDRMATILESLFQGTYSPMALSQLHHELDIASGSMRRVFRTATGFVGTGPRSVATGDEVWVLAGGNVPMVLRSLPHGNRRLVGEAYVHGLMHRRKSTADADDLLTEVILE